MGLIRNLIKEVTGTSSTQQSSQSRSRRVSESDYDSSVQATNSSGRGQGRTSDSGRSSSPGLVRGTIKLATDKITGTKPPQHRQDRVDGEHVATAEDVTKALELVTSACSDLQVAVDGLKKRGGVIGAVKVAATNISSSSSGPAPAASTGATTSSAAASNTTTTKQTSLPAPGAKGSSTPEGEEAAAAAAAPGTSGWAKTGEVLKTVGHDGRIPAEKLILEAHNKYEAAADLVDGLPEIDMAQSNAPALGKLAAPLGAAGQITMMAVGAGTAAFGIIHRVVKKKRTKKAANSVEGMLAEYEEVRLQLESLNHAGRGGMLGAPYSGGVAVPPVQQYSSRPPVHPPQAPPHYSSGAPAVGVPVGGVPPQYGYAPPAPQYAAPPPQQYQQQQYGAPPPQQYQQQQQQYYGAPAPQNQQQPASRQPLPDLL